MKFSMFAVSSLIRNSKALLMSFSSYFMLIFLQLKVQLSYDSFLFLTFQKHLVCEKVLSKRRINSS